jgi:hypothetical protein
MCGSSEFEISGALASEPGPFVAVMVVSTIDVAAVAVLRSLGKRIVDRFDQLCLGHLWATPDIEPFRHRQQMALACTGVDTTSRRGCAAKGGLTEEWHADLAVAGVSGGGSSPVSWSSWTLSRW